MSSLRLDKDKTRKILTYRRKTSGGLPEWLRSGAHSVLNAEGAVFCLRKED